MLASCYQPPTASTPMPAGIGRHYAGPFGNTQIAIHFQRVTADSLFGTSTVQGTTRPFKGALSTGTGGYTGKASEPGDREDDGAFDFIFRGDSLTGIWTPNKAGMHGGIKEFSLKRTH